MMFNIPDDAEFRRLASGGENQCSFCEDGAGIVARSFDENDVNVSNIFFCWDHWAEYLQQEFDGYVTRGGQNNGTRETGARL